MCCVAACTSPRSSPSPILRRQLPAVAFTVAICPGCQTQRAMGGPVTGRPARTPAALGKQGSARSHCPGQIVGCCHRWFLACLYTDTLPRYAPGVKAFLVAFLAAAVMCCMAPGRRWRIRTRPGPGPGRWSGQRPPAARRSGGGTSGPHRGPYRGCPGQLRRRLPTGRPGP